MKKISALILPIIISSSALAADFTVQFSPAAGSVGNTEVSSILSSKISDWSTAFASLFSSTIKAPTQQIFKAVGSGTYTKPAGVLYLRVVMIGGGGGGSGSGSGGAGGAGGNTTFGPSLLVANGASGAGGGSASLGSATGISLTGGNGASNIAQSGSYIFEPGGHGATSPFGGAGASGNSGSGGSAVPNTGSGGAGAGAGTVATGSGTGGGAGGYVNAIISSPASSYTYNVGAGGNGGVGSTNTGGAGGSGFIEVTEYYQ